MHYRIICGSEVHIIIRKRGYNHEDTTCKKDCRFICYYNGVQIYIQNVDENNETTRIYPLNDLNNEQEIPLSRLIEY
ncbi:small, acid-soluble spore protein, H family [Bacillus sp. S10(2024)]|uniref:small, acid-soluble spore protein, H family n=1 Tax=Bacillus sp. S10(2024) TaxID=3162886 RepID=UPI003D1B9C17